MAKERPPLPSRDKILAFIQDSEKPVGRREIARAFNIKGADRAWLRHELKKLKEDGLIGGDRRRAGGRTIRGGFEHPRRAAARAAGAPSAPAATPARPSVTILCTPRGLYFTIQLRCPDLRLRSPKPGSSLSHVIPSGSEARRAT